MSIQQAVDTYSRVMVEAFDEKSVIGVSRGFQTFFGRVENGSKTVFSPNANVVDIDIMRGNEKTAALIQRNASGRSNSVANPINTNEQKYTNFSRAYPLGEEISDIDSEQLNSRVAGENPYAASITKFDRLRILGIQHHEEHIRRFVRMFERLAAQSVILGVQDSILGTANTDLQYDFRRASGNTITVANPWDGGSATIIADIDAGNLQFRTTSKTSPDMMILGSSAMNSFINDSDVQAQADNRRFELIQVSSNNPVPDRFARFVSAGFNARGLLRTPSGYELWLFSYVDRYSTNAGVFTPFMPVDKAVIASSRSRNDRYFGPSNVLPKTQARIQFYQEWFGFSPLAAPMPMNIKDLGATVLPAMFYFDAYMSSNAKTLTQRTQTAPIFATTQTDAFVTLDGLKT